MKDVKRRAVVCQKIPEKCSYNGIELNFSNPLELTVAAILSAQCTDQRVNQVTEQLFRRYRSAKDYATLSWEISRNRSADRFLSK